MLIRTAPLSHSTPKVALNQTVFLLLYLRFDVAHYFMNSSVAGDGAQPRRGDRKFFHGRCRSSAANPPRSSSCATIPIGVSMIASEAAAIPDQP